MKSIADSTNKRKYLFSTFTHEVTQMNKPSLGDAALWYAQRGIFVFPLNQPRFDQEGNCVGCTCEAWKRTQPQYGPDYTCDQPGKCPRVRWRERSTVDLAQIERWWRAWPWANIGIDAGKSGMLIPDFDTYKAGILPAHIGADENTPIVLTPRDGMHLWYRMPAGLKLGNEAGTLPAGIDVRGDGGYVVAPPSIGANGKSYRFADGHKPTDCKIADLPAHLLAWLQKSPASAQSTEIIFAGNHPSKPDLARWRLSSDIVRLIVHGKPKGERSDASWRVCWALVGAGASPDDVRAVMVHYAIGEKYREKKGHGDKWLARDLGKINLSTPAVDTVDPLVAGLSALWVWVGGAKCIKALKTAGVCRTDDVREALRLIVDKARARRVTKVEMSSRELGEKLCRPHMAASRYLRRLVQIGWLPVASDQDGYAKVFDLSGLITRVKNEMCVSVTPSSQYGERGSGISGSPEGGGCNTYAQFVFDHLGDGAFYPYPLRYAAKLRPTVALLPRGLSASTRVVAGLLYHLGDLPQPEIAKVTGYSRFKVRNQLRLLDSMGLLVIWGEGRHRRFELHPNFEERLDDLRPKLPGYGQGHMLAAKAAGARAKFLTTQLEQCDPSERVRLEARRDAYRDKEEMHRQAAIAMGLDVDARLAPPRRKVDGPEPMWRLRLRASSHAGDDAWDRQMAVDLRVAHRQTHRRKLTITPALPTIEVEEDPLMPPNWFDVLPMDAMPMAMAV